MKYSDVYKDYDKITNLFLELLRFNTSSNPKCFRLPSSKGQIELLKFLTDKLLNMGVEPPKIDLNKNGYIIVTIPQTDDNLPSIGFLTHLDTYPVDINDQVKPIIIENYRGKNINLGKNIFFSEAEFPELLNYRGQTIIVSEGENILGADDKAGICEILIALEFILRNKEVKHGEIKIVFTTDEEIGRSMLLFDFDEFKCDFAYSIDGGEVGEISYENANFQLIKYSIDATDKMKLKKIKLIINDIIKHLDENCLFSLGFNNDSVYIYNYVVSDSKIFLDICVRFYDNKIFDYNLKKAKEIVSNCLEQYNLNYYVKDKLVYRNIFNFITNNPQVLNRTLEVFKNLNVIPKIVKMKGGADCVRISNNGIPCINIFTGVHNEHTPYEFISLESMEKAIDVIIELMTYKG